jgi:hydrogenase nickel incorporation protein HypA/HybF
MHELSVTENILKITLEYAEKEKATKVTDIYLNIGQLSSIVDDSVQFYWDLIAKDTICESAKLTFNRIPARMSCKSCQNEYNLGPEPGPCPVCGSHDVLVISGDEFQMDSINIEK